MSQLPEQMANPASCPIAGYAVRAAEFLLKKHEQPWWTRQCRSWAWYPTICIVDYSSMQASRGERRSLRKWRGPYALYQYFYHDAEPDEGCPDHQLIDSFATLEQASSAAWSMVERGEAWAATFRERPVIEWLRYGEKPDAVTDAHRRVPFTWSKDDVANASAASDVTPETHGGDPAHRQRLLADARLFLERFSANVSDADCEELVASLNRAIDDGER